ncbi:hypothetical protein Dsin_013352 [Dipteronia sinensis]|uniref:RNase H type-1 domain-containing protein n=1 Tax=Dipteronia sinensis TaxID=43782 RepID=A0AAE0E9C8_9ROSI|nr:hypothetical protein Dsin_013352 [Dipteronia sinensis]
MGDFPRIYALAVNKGISIRKIMSDALAWSHCLYGLFRVGSFIRCLEEQNDAADSNSKLLWQGICPPKVKRCVDPPKVKMKSSSKWLAPTGNALLFNVDGSAMGNPRMAGTCGVLRNSAGRIICLFSSSVGIQDAISAELMAIHKACCLVASKQDVLNCKVIIASDSKVALSWINDEKFGSLKHVDLVYDIRSYLSFVEGVRNQVFS